MNPTLPAEAEDLRAAARAAVEDLGDVDTFRRAELDPNRRRTEVAPVLDALGIDEIDPRDGDIALAAAAVLCEVGGDVALPYPVASALVRDDEQRPTAVVPSGRTLVDHGDLFPQWRVATLAGDGGTASGATDRLGSRLGRFVAEVRVDDAADPAPPADVDLVLTLACWRLLGIAARAVEAATAHVTDRVQFGRPLSEFQAVRFQLADAAVGVTGLRELASFTLWRLEVAPHEARTDVLALRLHAADTVRAVLGTCQQLHGAAGVCDEYDVSVLVRAAQPALRLPEAPEHTLAALTDAIDSTGFAGLFPHDRVTR